MAGATLILGVLLLILITRTPKDKPLFSGVTKVLMIFPLVLWVMVVGFFALRAPLQLPRMFGQATGTLLILLIFVGIGYWIRKSRA